MQKYLSKYEWKLYWKNTRMQGPFFHNSKLNLQKQWDVVSKSIVKIYPSNKPKFIIDQLWNTLQLKNIVLSFHPPFEPPTFWANHCPFYNYRSVTWSDGFDCPMHGRWSDRFEWYTVAEETFEAAEEIGLRVTRSLNRKTVSDWSSK